MKKVAVVGTVGLPACYGGFESLVENLVRYKAEDISYEVFCSKLAYKTHPSEFAGAQLTYIPLNANGTQSILYDIWSLIKCIRSKPNVILILGVSGCLFLPIFKRLSKAKIVTNIDGIEWKRDKWGKWTRKFLRLSESIAVKYSDVVIADNQEISDYVVEEYGKNTEVIAYGGDHAIRDLVLDSSDPSYSLGLCRIEPEHNVEMILEAFSKTQRWLRFVGNWDKSQYGIDLKAKYSQFKNIQLIDPIYNLDELYILRKGCDLYLHGHSAGGTNPSLVEMMHFGVPIYAYDCKFNRYSTEGKAQYFSSSNHLLVLINEKTAELDELNGVAMKEIANQRYTWELIAKQYDEILL